MTPFSFVKRFMNYSISTKLVVSFVLISLVSVSIVAFVSNYFARQNLIINANHNLLAVAEHSADNLDLFLINNLDSVQIYAQLPVLKVYLSLPAEQRANGSLKAEVITTLNTLSRKNQLFYPSYTLFDQQGVIVFTSDDIPGNSNQSEQDYFQQPLTTRLPYISSVQFEKATASWVLSFSSPILNEQDKAIGVLRARYDATILQSIMTKNNGLGGDNSFSILLDENYISLAHGLDPTLNFKPIVPLAPEKIAELEHAGRLLKLSELSTNLPDFAAGLAKVNGNEPYFTSQLTAFNAQLSTAAVIQLKTKPWLLVFAQPEESYLAPIQAQGRNFLFLAVGIALIIAFVAFGMGRFFARPIVELTEIAKQVAGGNLLIQANITSQDEVGQLGQVFNSMTSQLKELIDTLEARVASRTHRLEVSASLSEQLNALLDFNQLLVALVNQIKDNFNYYHVHIYLLDSDQQTLIMAEGTGEAGREMKRRGHRIALSAPASLVAQAAREGQVVSVANVREAENWLANPLLPDTHAEMAVPIVREGQVVGVLDVQSDKIGGLDEGDANLLRSLAGQVAVAMSNARLFAQNQATLRETETLFTISQRMLVANNLTELITAIVEEAPIEAINRVVLFVFEYDKTGNMVAITCQANWHSGQGTKPTAIGTRYLRDSVPILNFFITETPIIFADMSHDDRVDAATSILTQRSNLYAMAVLPLWSQGQQLGVLLLEGEEPYTFNEQEIRPYQAMLGQLSVAVENQHLLQQTIQAKEEAEQARARADLANQAKSEFLSNMSHELRTPLNGILGYTQILKRNKDLTTLQKDGLNIIHQSGEHLLTLINDILDLAKVEAGKMELHPSPVHLGTFLETIVNMMEVRANQKGITLLYEPLVSVAFTVNVDEKRLRQILLNLLNNAVKFTDKGEVILRVSSLDELASPGLTRPFEQLRFEIIDSGVGMTPEQLGQIFNSFVQVGDAQRRAEGTGLGLVITRRLVEAMDSHLYVTSEYGQGSTFWFEVTLPIISDSSDLKRIMEQPIIGYEGARRKILVVDDKSVNRAVLVNMLEPLGFELYVAEDGQQAVEQTLTNQPDLIIMDMIMPIMTGFEATQIIRQKATGKKIIIIGSSASTFEKDIQQVKLVGCDTFLPKPLDFKQLLTVMAEFLQLTWLYEQGEALSTEILPDISPEVKMILPPSAELNSLLELAKLGDLRAVRKRLTALEPLNEQYKPFIDKLQGLAKAYEDKQMVALLQQYLEGQI